MQKNISTNNKINSIQTVDRLKCVGLSISKDFKIEIKYLNLIRTKL